MSYSDNVEDVLAGWDGMNATRSHEIEVQNVMEYASYLQKKHGLYVFNDTKLLEILWKVMSDILLAGLPLNDANIKRGLESAGWEYINFLRSLTGQMKPPVKAGEGMRKAHPGGWSDVTGNLASAFLFMINGGDAKFIEGESMSISDRPT